MKTPIPLACLTLAFAGCNAGTMVVDSSEGRTIYSKYYDAGDWIIPHHLGMSVGVDHEKTEIPVVHGIQQSIGALGPSDSEANGKVTVYIWNRDREAYRVKIIRISSRDSVLEPKEKEIIGVEGQRTEEEVGDIQIFNYGTEIPLKIEYELNGKPAMMELTVTRRTYEELKKYFGPGGIPPYPWYHDHEKKG